MSTHRRTIAVLCSRGRVAANQGHSSSFKFGYIKMRSSRNRACAMVVVKCIRHLFFLFVLCEGFHRQLYSLSFENIAIGLDSIRQDKIKATVEFLASSHFRGRATGSPEAMLTAGYISSIFQRNGLKPLLHSSDFIQSFEITRTIPKPNSYFELRQRGGESYSFRINKDFVPASWGADALIMQKEGVFVGYGITAPRLNYDDYEGLDIRDKIVIMLTKVPDNEQDSFRQVSRTDYGDPIRKSIWAAHKGAAGVIRVLGPEEKLPSSSICDFNQAEAHLTIRLKSLKIPVITLTFEAGQQLLSKCIPPHIQRQNLSQIIQLINKELRPQTFKLEGELRLATEYRRRPVQGYNIIGVIPGSDPTLKDEYIIIGAHHDHVGVDDKGQIFFGADDNASGTAALLELSEAFQANMLKPRRSILLAAWGAEEIGLLGSRYYIRKPAVPLENTVAMFQMDMIGRNAQHQADAVNSFPREVAAENQNSLNVLGTWLSPDLRSSIETSNIRAGLDLKFPSDLEAIELMRRSDQWPFLKQGIPVLFLFTGFHPDYHQLTDTADKINFAKMEKILRLLYLTVWELTEARDQPTLKKALFEKLTYTGKIK